MESDLRRALVGHEFEVHYQPIVNLQAMRSARSRLSSAGSILSEAWCHRPRSFPSRRKSASSCHSANGS
jgi:EAL domain-containing protein (putative c-di-GMP-specific phosphodiesterase class I)